MHEQAIGLALRVETRNRAPDSDSITPVSPTWPARLTVEGRLVHNTRRCHRLRARSTSALSLTRARMAPSARSVS
jgi:hypothetical protein